MSGVDVMAVLDDELIKAKSRGDEQGHAYLREARAATKEFRDAAVEFYAGLQAMVLCQEQNAPADIAQAVNERTARACERFDAALLKFDGGAE